MHGVIPLCLAPAVLPFTSRLNGREKPEVWILDPTKSIVLQVGLGRRCSCSASTGRLLYAEAACPACKAVCPAALALLF